MPALRPEGYLFLYRELFSPYLHQRLIFTRPVMG